MINRTGMGYEMASDLTTGDDRPVDKATKADELRAFLFLTVFLAPIVAVICVGGYGFAVWMSHLLLGPPT